MHLTKSLLAAIFFLHSLPGFTADIWRDRSQLFIKGEIRPGDSERLVTAIGDSAAKTLSLDTNGGSVEEAWHIAELVKGMHLDTRVTKGGYCVSACFFIFLEGWHRAALSAMPNGKMPLRADGKMQTGLVGIHRPYISKQSGDVASVRKQEEIMENVRRYLRQKNVPQRLIDEMMSRPSNDIYWLSEDDVVLMGEFNPGVEEALVTNCGWVGTRRQINENWSAEKSNSVYDCVSSYWDKYYYSEQIAYLGNLHKGWRPWKN